MTPSPFTLLKIDTDWSTLSEGRRDLIIETNDLDTLLYYIFRDIAFDIASKYERPRRDPRKDFRRMLFAKQIELLSILSSDWAERERQHHADILVDNPFIDVSPTCVLGSAKMTAQVSMDLPPNLVEMCNQLSAFVRSLSTVEKNTAPFFEDCLHQIFNGSDNERMEAVSRIASCASIAQYAGFDPAQEQKLHEIIDCAQAILSSASN